MFEKLGWTAWNICKTEAIEESHVCDHFVQKPVQDGFSKSLTLPKVRFPFQDNGNALLKAIVVFRGKTQAL